MVGRHMHPKNQRYRFGFGFGYFANLLQISNKNSNLYSNPYPKTKNLFFYFKLSYCKFAIDLQNTQTQTTNNNMHRMIETVIEKHTLIILFNYI